MKKIATRILIPALLACLLLPALTGCQEKEMLRPDERVSVSFSIPVGQTAGGLATKMSEEVVQNDLSKTSFRGIQDLYIVPFSIPKQGSAWREYAYADDEYSDIRTLSATKSPEDYKDDNNKTIKGYIYDNVVMNRDVNTVLVYGQAYESTSNALASSSVTHKQRYGSLIPTQLMGENAHSVGAIRFDLEPFLNSETRKQAFSTWKSANITLLNDIADASVTIGTEVYSLKTPSSYNNDPLEKAFDAFTSKGVVFPGSNEMIGLKLTALYKSCTALSSTGDSEAVRKLAAQVCTIMDGKKEQGLLEIAADGTVTRTVAAGEVFGLPDGVVTLRWGITLSDGSLGFDSPDKSQGVNVTAVDAFCYPPALWYYVNSPLLSNSEDDAKDQFVANKKWSDILDSSKGWIRGVTNASRVAAVRDQLQYAVALLKLDIQQLAGTTTLKDKTGKDIPVNNSYFPLTGIVFGGQRTQAFDFTVWDDPNNDMRFIYDADLNDKNGQAQAWISSTADSKPVYTLALATRMGEDINFALEFRNDSDQSFTGARDCVILPGSKFYLIGTMEYSKGTTSETTKPASVFVKDHYTTLKVSFNALAASYAILPDLNRADLQLGVNAKLTWDAVTPTSIPIK